MKVLLVIGHTPNTDKGAYSTFLKQSEFDYNKKVVSELKKLSDCDVTYDVYTHKLQNYYNRQKAMADFANSGNYDLIIEFHFNAASPLANGTECLYWFNSQKGKNVCQELSQAISKQYGTTLRGDKGSKALVNKNDRGYWFTYLPKAVAIILEPFFGSNEEANKFSDIKTYSETLHKTISKLKL